MHRLPGNVCSRFFSFPARSHITIRWCRSSCVRSTTVPSIETWPSCVSESTRRRPTCLMDADSSSLYVPHVAFLLRRREPKYRESLFILLLPAQYKDRREGITFAMPRHA